MNQLYTLPLADPQAALASVGGKGASLAHLCAAGLPVPDGFHTLRGSRPTGIPYEWYPHWRNNESATATPRSFCINRACSSLSVTSSALSSSLLFNQAFMFTSESKISLQPTALFNNIALYGLFVNFHSSLV